MAQHNALFVAAPLSGFRKSRGATQLEEGPRPRIGHVALFVAAFVATAVIALSFPAQTAAEVCTACVVSAGASPTYPEARAGAAWGVRRRTKMTAASEPAKTMTAATSRIN